MYSLFIILKLTIFKAEGLSFYHLELSLEHWNMGFNKVHGKISLRLARSFIQHILSPVRSVHHPVNNCPFTFGSALPRWHIFSIQVRTPYVYYLLLTYKRMMYDRGWKYYTSSSFNPMLSFTGEASSECLGSVFVTHLNKYILKMEELVNIISSIQN